LGQTTIKPPLRGVYNRLRETVSIDISFSSRGDFHF
jgi:hypothetical protein